MFKGIMAAIAVAGLLASVPAEARGNRPCSGSKGGVSHCKGGKFVCKNGSISQSKRTCSQ